MDHVSNCLSWGYQTTPNLRLIATFVSGPDVNVAAPQLIDRCAQGFPYELILGQRQPH
jgi:hypothetical protein